MFKTYVSRSVARAASIDHPIGDPFGGPAYGEKEDFGSVISAVAGPLIGGIFGSKSSGDAADEQSNAADQANATQRYMYDTTRADNAPFQKAGADSVNRLAYLLGTSDAPGTVKKDVYTLDDFIDYNRRIAPPGYSQAGQLSDAQIQYSEYLRGGTWADPAKTSRLGFRELKDTTTPDDPNGEYGSLLRRFSQADLAKDVPFQLGHEYAQQQGQAGVNRLAAANGSLLSGATLKALQDRGASIANQYAGDAANRYSNDQANVYNKLAGVAGAGQQAVSSVGSAGQNYANQVSNNQIGVGNARGASAIAKGNAMSGAIGQAFNNFTQQNYLGSLGGGANGYNNNAFSGQF